MTRFIIPALLVVSGAAVLAAANRQPQIVEIRSAPELPSSAIHLRRVAVLGRAADSVLPDQVLSLARDSRGRMFATPSADRRHVLVYDARGRLLRALGRGGKGPGEFAYPAQVFVGRGDSLFVVDPGIPRLTVFTPRLTLARTVQLPFRPDLSMLREDRGLWMVASVPTREGIGEPLHLLSADGRLVRSFGGSGQPVRPDQPYEWARIVAPARSGGLWSAPLNRYEIEQWDERGRRARTLRRSVPWFAPWTGEPDGRHDEVRPTPRLIGLREDARGLLWVFIQVPERGWRPAPGRRPRRAGEERGVVPNAERERYVDTIIEVIDPTRGRLLASARWPKDLWVYLDSGPVAHTWRHAPDGEEDVEVWEFSLRIPNEEG